MLFAPRCVSVALRFAASLIPLFALLPAAVSAAQQSSPPAPVTQSVPPPSTRDAYTKFEAYIPMRDGVRLWTVVFVPRDQSKTYPILLERTPYGVPYGPDNFPRTLGPSAEFGQSGYIVAYQDVRGTHMSEGTFANVRPLLPPRHGPTNIDEATDAYDTIDWLVRCVPTNNGSVGIWGVSYPGFYASAGALCGHPALKAVSPQAPVTDWFLGDDLHHNGAFFLMDDFDWTWRFDFDYPRAALTRGNPQPHHEFPGSDAYQFYLDLGPLKNADANFFKETVPYWKETVSHGTYDHYWRERSVLPHLNDVKPAMLLVGGWFDAEDFFGTMATFRALEQQSPGTASFLAVGPWPHGGWGGGGGTSFGGIAFGEPTGEEFRAKIEFPFFEYYLKGVGTPPSAKAQVFDTGANRWLSFDAWPPRNTAEQSLYLQSDHALSFDAPPESNGAPYDGYTSDPANPVPYSAHAHTQAGRYVPSMAEDQRFVDDRPDVLTYRSAPLEADKSVVGRVGVDLYVQTTGTDADFVVKLIDIYPDADALDAAGKPLANEEILVRGDILRAKFRDSFEKPSPLKPGETTRIHFDLPDICHTFPKGHRIAVQIQSSWFPLVDRNPQTFTDIYSAQASAFQKADIRVYRDAGRASHLVLRVTSP